MKAYLILISTVFVVLLFSCDNDRNRIIADEIQLDGTWRFDSMTYKNPGGKPITILPSGTPKNPTVTLTFIDADRTGLLRIDKKFHNFTYYGSKNEFTFTFDKKGELPIEDLSFPTASVGKLYSYSYSKTVGRFDGLQFYAERQFLKTSSEEVTGVKYFYIRM